jgi:Mrp family chromosome partitioning ATPase
VSDRIVIDTSPVGATAEVLEFVRYAQTVLVTIRLGHTSIGSARRAMEMIRALHKGDVLLVIVGGGAKIDDYYYGADDDAPKSRLFKRRSNRNADVRETVSV